MPREGVVALLWAVVLGSMTSVAYAFECSGMGRRYCDGAHRYDDCPETCLMKNCQVESPSLIDRSGVEPLNPRWDELADTGLYDHVYVFDREICLASCWYKPWKAECLDWDYDKRTESDYCRRLSCEHDEGNSDNDGNRYVGCHRDADTGNMKRGWHRPTCDECRRVFPGCQAELGHRKYNRTKNELKDIFDEDGKINVDSSADSGGWSHAAENDFRRDWRMGVYANAETNHTMDAEMDDYDAANGPFYDDFDAAPNGWKMLFEDDVTHGDVSTSAVTNVVMQFAGPWLRAQKPALINTMAEFAGVEDAQVILLVVFEDDEGNTTSPSGMITTISVGIVGPDPHGTAMYINAIDQQLLATMLLQKAGMSFLPGSMSTGTKRILQDKIDVGVQSRAETVDVFALEAKEHEGNSSPIPLGTALLIGAICVVVFAAVAVLFYMAVAMRRNPTTSHQDPKKTDRGVDSNSDAGTDAFDQDAAAIQTVYDTERASALRSLSGGSRIEETGGGLLPALTTKEALPADPAESGQALDDDRNCCSVDIVEAKEPSCDYHAALGAFTSPPDHNVKMPADDSSAGDPTGHAYRTRTVTM